MDKIEANRNFANKLWNCCKFVTGNALRDVIDDELAQFGVDGPIGKEEFETLALPERYIVSKCHTLVSSVTEDIENYQLGVAGSKVSLRIGIFFLFFLRFDLNALTRFLFRYTSSCGISMPIGTLRFPRLVSMNQPVVTIERKRELPAECWSMCWIQVCDFYTLTCPS